MKYKTMYTMKYKNMYEAVENAKLTCLANMGKKFNNPNISQKSY